MVKLVMMILVSVSVYDDKVNKEYFHAGFEIGDQVVLFASKELPKAEKRLKAFREGEQTPENIELFHKTRVVYHKLAIQSHAHWMIPVLDLEKLKPSQLGIPSELIAVEAIGEIEIKNAKTAAFKTYEPVKTIDVREFDGKVLTIVDEDTVVVQWNDKGFVIIDNVDTKKLADGADFNFALPMRVTGTKSFKGESGINRTLFVLRVEDDPKEIFDYLSDQGNIEHPYQHKFELLKNGPIEGIVVDSDEKTITIIRDKRKLELKRLELSANDKKWCKENYW